MNFPTLLVYSTYSMLFVMSLLLIVNKKKYQTIGVFCLIMLAPFQITTLFDIGFGFSFFETSLLISSMTIFIRKLLVGKLEFVLNKWAKIFGIMLCAIFITVIIAYFRRLFGDLEPLSGYKDNTILFRSFMGCGRLIFYTLSLLIIKKHISVSGNLIWRSVLISSFLPIIALLYQEFLHAVPLSLYANNSTFSMDGVWLIFNGIPPKAFTQELTFFCFYTIFSIVAGFELYDNRRISASLFLGFLFLQIFGVLLAASRMGVLSMVIILFLYMRKQLSLIKSGIVIIGLGLLSVFISNIQQYVSGLAQYASNYERVTSLLQIITQQNYSFDGSAFDRITSMIAAFNVFIQKGLLLGVGYFNLQFYSQRLESSTNHSFIIQLLAEFGLPLFIIFCLIIYFISRKMISGEKKWLLNLSIYSLSGIPLHAPFTYLLILLPGNKVYDK
jgi:hypothetical protein